MIFASLPLTLRRIGTIGSENNYNTYSSINWDKYPLAAQLIIPSLDDSSTDADERLTGSRTRYTIDTATRSGQTISITLDDPHGKTTNSTWVSTNLYDQIITAGLGVDDSESNNFNPNKNSPPNSFMNKLEIRMKHYYQNIQMENFYLLVSLVIYLSNQYQHLDKTILQL